MTIQRLISAFAFGAAALAFATIQGFALEHELVIKALVG